MRQHPWGDVHADQRPHRQVGDRQGHQAGAATQVEHRSDAFARRDQRMLLQDCAEQARHAVAERNEMLLEPFGVTVEHRAQILDRSARRTRHDARCGNEVTHIGIVRAELQGFGIGVRRFRMLAEAGQRVTEQTERTGVGDAGAASLLRQPDGLAKIAAAHAKQDGGVAWIDPAGCGIDAAQQRG